MTSLPILLFAIIPIGFILAAETLIRKRSSADTISRQIFLLLAWTGIGLLGVITISTWLMPSPGNSIPILLAPALTGIIALFLLHLPDWKELLGREKTTLLITLILLIILGLAGLTVVLLKDDG